MPENTDSQLIAEELREIKSEVKALRSELNRIEGSILKDRVKAIEEVLSRNRLLLFVGQLEDDLNEELEKIMVPRCENGLRPQCMAKFKALSTDSFNLIKNSSPTEALTDLDAKISKIGEMLEKEKGSQCEFCHGNIQKKLRKEKRALQTIVLVENPNENNQSEKELNYSYLVEMVLEPLASPERLKIIASLSEGKKGFSRLAQITGLRGGHLIYHIKKLLAAGLIAQEDNKGDYVITQKGIEVSRKISLFQLG